MLSDIDIKHYREDNWLQPKPEDKSSNWPQPKGVTQEYEIPYPKLLPTTETNERDPHGKVAHEPGAKLDAGKSPVRRGLLEYFPRACLAVAEVSASGASKYTWKGWESVLEGVDRYGDAECRHICKAAIEGPTDKDYGHLHAAHEAWNALARLELLLREKE